MKFRKKPLVIEAMQYTGENEQEILKFANEKAYIEYGLDGAFFKINTLEGSMEISINDWIIEGIKGEFYPCKPDVFESTYVKVCETSERLRCKPIRRGGMS